MSLQDKTLTVQMSLRLDDKSHRRKIEALARKYKSCGKIHGTEVLLTMTIVRCEQEKAKLKLKKYFLRLQPLEMYATCLDRDVWPLWHATGRRGKQELEFFRFHVHGRYSPPNSGHYR
jgi:hypothetical protein